MDRVHDKDVDVREGPLDLFPQAAFRDIDFPFHDEDAAVIQGRKGRDAKDVSDCVFAGLGGLANLVKEAPGGFPVGGETLEPMEPGEEGIGLQRRFGGGPEQACGRVVGEGFEAPVVLDCLQVGGNVQAGAGCDAQEVVAPDVLVLLGSGVEGVGGGDIGDAFRITLLAFRRGDGRGNFHLHRAHIPVFVDGNGEPGDAGALEVVAHDPVLISADPGDAGILAGLHLQHRRLRKGSGLDAALRRFGSQAGRVPAVCDAGLQGGAGEPRGPDAPVGRLGDGRRGREDGGLFGHPEGQVAGFRNRYGNGLGSALHGHQQDFVDACIGRKAFQLQPHIGTGVAYGEERIALLGQGRIGEEPVLREQAVGHQVAGDGRPVLEPDGLMDGPLRLCLAGEDGAGCQACRQEECSFHLVGPFDRKDTKKKPFPLSAA